MATLNEIRAQLVQKLIDGFTNNKLAWTYIEDQRSVQTTHHEYQVHLDQVTGSGKGRYRVWIFDDKGDEIDKFTDDLIDKDFTPNGFAHDTYAEALHDIFTFAVNKEKFQKLALAVSKLSDI